MRNSISFLLSLGTAAAVTAALAAAMPASAASNKGTRDLVLLSAAEVTPGPGQTDADGGVTLYLQRDGSLCFFLDSDNLAGPLQAVHLHRGAVGHTGDLLVELYAGPASDPDVSRCHDLDDRLVRDIDRNMADYYIDVHTDAFPGGALRGQLDNGGPLETTVNMSGQQVVPIGSGDPDGGGGFLYGVSSSGRLCFDASTGNVSAPLTAVDLHLGAPGESGAHVQTLHGFSSDNDAIDCVDIGPAVAEDLADNPGDYYIDVHNEEYPDGALRAQLH